MAAGQTSPERAKAHGTPPASPLDPGHGQLPLRLNCPWERVQGRGCSRHGGLPWSLACDVSDTLTASWLLKEFTPIMPVCAGVLPRVGIWLWLRGTLYNASAMSAARFKMISWGGRGSARSASSSHGPLGSTGPLSTLSHEAK